MKPYRNGMVRAYVDASDNVGCEHDVNGME